ncbi:MAG: glycosyltransferase family 25 protein [Simkaniaceae bacterium]|nr:glycosyltransferase family 25 protein [Simkaniaceae bacterium]
MYKKILFCLLTFLSIEAKVQDYFKQINNKTKGHSFGCINFVYMINLDHRTEKYQMTMDQLAPFGIKPFRFSAVNGWRLTTQDLQEIGVKFDKTMRRSAISTHFLEIDGKEVKSHELLGKVGRTYFCHCITRGPIGCYLSHLSILQDAYDSGYEVIWIVEDDIEVMRNPKLLLKYINELNQLVGKNQWDLFFTDVDYRIGKNKHLKCVGADFRPNYDTRDQSKFSVDHPVSKNLRRVSSRFGSHSMIWTRAGMKKMLDFSKKYQFYLPYDLDFHLPPGIQIYAVRNDVVTNKLDSISDNGKDGSK